MENLADMATSQDVQRSNLLTDDQTDADLDAKHSKSLDT